MADKGQSKDIQSPRQSDSRADFDNFVLEKGIFSNIFEKDIRRVYIYKKSERLAKAIHLITPAFESAPSLSNKLDQIAVALIDAAILPPQGARSGMSRALLALSSVLSIARTGGLLSVMNAELIAHEAHQLLEEIASYEEPRLFLDDAPTLAALSRDAERVRGETLRQQLALTPASVQRVDRAPQPPQPKKSIGQDKGHISDKSIVKKNDRQEAIKSVLRSKGPSYIKDISTVIRDVSEKTIQRELQSLVESGEVLRTGERRWTTYTLAA